MPLRLPFVEKSAFVVAGVEYINKCFQPEQPDGREVN